MTPAKKKTAGDPPATDPATDQSAGPATGSVADVATDVETEVEAKAGEAEPHADELPEGAAPAVGGNAAGIVPTDARERFRQALEAKNSRPGDHPGSQSTPGAHLKGSNSKRKREFRRKSG